MFDGALEILGNIFYTHLGELAQRELEVEAQGTTSPWQVVYFQLRFTSNTFLGRGEVGNCVP